MTQLWVCPTQRVLESRLGKRADQTTMYKKGLMSNESQLREMKVLVQKATFFDTLTEAICHLFVSNQLRTRVLHGGQLCPAVFKVGWRAHRLSQHPLEPAGAIVGKFILFKKWSNQNSP
eukprot:Lithocolla_globosa_v1_NODE_1771_length_2348_cov_4.579154.p2 type:complete len:119 gc:universal NODE_1771_length_2348_cov_4.579154:1803-2159(+)